MNPSVSNPHSLDVRTSDRRHEVNARGGVIQKNTFRTNIVPEPSVTRGPSCIDRRPTTYRYISPADRHEEALTDKNGESIQKPPGLILHCTLGKLRC
jgi:hypothetical protein